MGIFEPIQQGGLRYLWHEGAFLSRAEAEYALAQLWRLCAGTAEWKGKAVLDIAAIDSPSIESMHRLAQGALPWVALSDILPPNVKLYLDSGSLPALCGVGASASKGYRGKGSLPFDLVAATFLMLTRWEETLSAKTDLHGRFMAEASLAARQNYLERPVIDEWSLVLRAWITSLHPEWRPVIDPFRVLITCDLDHPLRYTSIGKVAVLCGSALLRKHSLRQAWRTFREGVRTLRDWRSDPLFQGLTWLLSLCEKAGITCEVYLMAASKNRFDEGYDLRRYPYEQIICEIINRDHSLGFHPGYTTLDNPDEFRAQKSRLESVLGRPISVGRQHYLRFRVPDTWKLWHESGMKRDATMAYSEAPGFRCGTCHPFPVFDIKHSRQLQLIEEPLVAMDVTLYQKLGLSTVEVKERLLRLARRCRAVDGAFNILVHNDIPKSWQPVFSEAIFKIMEMRLSSAA